MTADPTVRDRIHARLVSTLSRGSAEQLSGTFTVSDIVHALVPYRTYRGELGVETLQDYEHALLELLAGEGGLLVCDPDTVAVIQQELATPDPDTQLLRRLHTVNVRLGVVQLPVAAVSPLPPRGPISITRELPITTVDGFVPDAVAIGDALAREDAALAEAAAGPKDPMSSSAATTTEADDLAQATAAAREVVNAWAPPLPSVADLATTMPAPPLAPLPPVHGVTIATPETLSRIAPLSPASVYGDPIQFRGVRHAPADVGGVIFLFGMVARELGFMVEAISSGFPRCDAKRQLAPGKWSRLRIEFELRSRDFRDAGRDPSACDLLVCWDDTWADRPPTLDVLSLALILPTLASRE